MLFVPIQGVAFGIGTAMIFFGGFGAWLLPAAMAVGMLIQHIVFAIYFGGATGLTLPRWLIEVVLPVLLISLVGLAAGMLPVAVFAPGLLRLIVTTSTTFIVLVPVIWTMGLNEGERRSLRFFASKKMPSKFLPFQFNKQ